MAASSQFITAHDGLKLHVERVWVARGAALPVVCLPGLARTGADFDALATALAGDREQPRHVVAIDYRGRGRSDYDRDPFNYNFATELADVLAVLTALDIGPAVFVGTSRGGILAMLLASARPTAIAGVVLNDIGPVIEVQGLARIKSYVGNLPEPKSFADGAEILRRLFVAQFPKLSEDDWIAFSRRAFKEQDGRLLPTYDVRIAKTLEGIDLGAAAAVVVDRIRGARPGAGDGHSRRQLRRALARDRRSHAGAPAGPRCDRGAGSGACPAAGGARDHRPCQLVHRPLRAIRGSSGQSEA